MDFTVLLLRDDGPTVCVDIGFVLSPVKMFCGCLRNYDRVLPGTVTFWHLYVLSFSCMPY